MKRILAVLGLLVVSGCGEPEPARTTAQGRPAGAAPPPGVPQQSSRRPTLDIHTILNQPAKVADQRMGKPSKVDKDWRSYSPSGLGEIRIRYASNKPAEIVVQLAEPTDSAGAALRGIALNESRPADEISEMEETWKGSVGSEEWETVKVSRNERGWAKIHAITKPGSS